MQTFSAERYAGRRVHFSGAISCNEVEDRVEAVDLTVVTTDSSPPLPDQPVNLDFSEPLATT